MTHLGICTVELLAGETVIVSEAMMRRLCADFAAMTPRRYLRSIPRRGGDYRVSVIGGGVGSVR